MRCNGIGFVVAIVVARFQVVFWIILSAVLLELYDIFRIAKMFSRIY